MVVVAVRYLGVGERIDGMIRSNWNMMCVKGSGTLRLLDYLGAPAGGRG